MQDTSAEIFLLDGEDVLWRSRSSDRLQPIAKPRHREWHFIFHTVFTAVMIAVLIFMGWFFASVNFTGSGFIATIFGVFATIVFIVMIGSIIGAVIGKADAAAPHDEYLLTDERLVVRSDDGSELSIYPDAIMAIASNRLPIGYNVTVTYLGGEEYPESDLQLTRFTFQDAQTLERRLINWKRASKGFEHYEQTH